jgi:hypothetical protein
LVAERPVANISCIYAGENKFIIHVYKNDMHTEKRGDRNNYGNDCHRDSPSLSDIIRLYLFMMTISFAQLKRDCPMYFFEIFLLQVNMAQLNFIYWCNVQD